MNDDLITIDGSEGEGGGQVLRTSLTLSMLTGKPFQITSIRAKRKNPGLQAQHLESVRAAKRISDAEVRGDQIGSSTIRFAPQGVKSGEYAFRIGTAGSTSLVLQTLYLPLSFAGGDSKVLITGGTHVPWSPTFDFLKNCWLYFTEMVGMKIDLVMSRAGFYPHGGGEIHAQVSPSVRILPLNIAERRALQKIKIFSAHTNLTDKVAQRQAKQAAKQVSHLCETEVEVTQLPSLSRSTAFSVLGIFKNTRCCYTSLGERGKRAEAVAQEACDQFFLFLRSNATVDEHIADQIVLPLSFAQGRSEFITPRISNHLLTNIETIRKFVGVEVKVEGTLGEVGRIVIQNTDPSLLKENWDPDRK